MRVTASRAFDEQIELPLFRRVRQTFARPQVTNRDGAVNAALESVRTGQELAKGSRVAITAGSRGISHIGDILRAVADWVRRRGGDPFLIPAMGSHGGATAEGQVALLHDLGITQETVGAPIHSSMDVVQIGELEIGMPIYVDRLAAEADAVLVVNRVKPHTDFSGEWESGLAKMAAVGLGKRAGAEAVHRYGVRGLRELIPQAARLIVRRLPVRAGVAIIENAYDDVADVIGLAPTDIAGPAEADLLRRARRLMPSLPFQDIDVLVIDEMGKNISGAGMDSNVLGRMRVHGLAEPTIPDVRMVVVLDLTRESHGNAVGLGLADVTTEGLLEQVDLDDVYINAITSGITGVQRAAIPIVAPDDQAAIATALQSCGRPDVAHARVVRIRSTLDLEMLDVSEALWDQVAARDALSFASATFSLPFDDAGRLDGIREPAESLPERVE